MKTRKNAYPFSHFRFRSPSTALRTAPPVGPFVAVDTEFMRETTYWPELCLIQAADGVEAAAIELAEGMDLGPVARPVARQVDVLKVFHAGGQDFESSAT